MFDRDLWRGKFSAWLTWPCPSCGSVALARRKKNAALLQEETGPSKRAHSHDEWDPDWIEGRFSAILECHNPACGELVSVSGSTSTEEDYYEDEEGRGHRGYGDVFTPLFFEPAPPVFLIPKKCPERVAKQLKSAFALIWCDVAAAANRLRAAVEALLDDQGVQKTAKSKQGKRGRISTHDRIGKLKPAHQEVANYLMAIKWLGNSGSHEGMDHLTRADILDAFELFEASIDLLYVRKADEFARLAAKINKRKGKPKKARLQKGDWDLA